MINKKLGIPYMGSKRRLAHKIVDHILEKNPNTKYVYDLFGGGGAISFELLQRSQIERVYYNELDSGVCELIKKIQKDGVTDEFFEWVDRDTFHKLKNGSDWKAGLVKTCWSFGNNQITYLYGKNIESIKKEATEYLFTNGYDRTAKTRIKLIKEFKEKSKLEGRFELDRLQQPERLERLQRLEQLERLQQLQQLDRLQQLEVSNLSYDQVEINTPKENTVIYLDPPYITEQSVKIGKKEKSYYHFFNPDKLREWIDYKTQEGYKIYLSEYNYDLYLANQWEHRSTLSATNNSKKTIEKLFTNIPDKTL